MIYLIFYIAGIVSGLWIATLILRDENKKSNIVMCGKLTGIKVGKRV